MARPRPDPINRPRKVYPEPVWVKNLGFGMMGACSLFLGYIWFFADVKSYRSQEEQVADLQAQGQLRAPPHRCNDRIEDFCQVFANKYGSIWNDGRRSMGMVWRCMMSKEGLEPSDPYIMLNQSHRQYIDPVERLKRQQELLEKQNQAVAQ